MRKRSGPEIGARFLARGQRSNYHHASALGRVGRWASVGLQAIKAACLAWRVTRLAIQAARPSNQAARLSNQAGRLGNGGACLDNREANDNQQTKPNKTRRKDQ